MSKLYEARDYDGLAWISAVLCGSSNFTMDNPTYGLPTPAFIIVERLAWFAQGIRSGSWTYFEATPLERQHAMLSALTQDETHADFAAKYAFGIQNWHEPSALHALDVWLDENDERNTKITWQLASANRELIQNIING